MKKIKNIVRLLILITIMTIIPVNAANYELKELIPVNVETTIVTKHFSYRGFYYNDKSFKGADAYQVQADVFLLYLRI